MKQLAGRLDQKWAPVMEVAWETDLKCRRPRNSRPAYTPSYVGRLIAAKLSVCTPMKVVNQETVLWLVFNRTVYWFRLRLGKMGKFGLSDGEFWK